MTKFQPHIRGPSRGWLIFDPVCKPFYLAHVCKKTLLYLYSSLLHHITTNHVTHCLLSWVSLSQKYFNVEIHEIQLFQPLHIRYEILKIAYHDLQLRGPFQISATHKTFLIVCMFTTYLDKLLGQLKYHQWQYSLSYFFRQYPQIGSENNKNNYMKVLKNKPQIIFILTL